MKFSLFVHMERFDPAQSHAELYKDLVTLVQTAEDGGFDTAWVGEHHAMEFTISPNPFIVLANLAGTTSRIRLGTGTVVAPFWHPIKLAGEAAMTDIATGGRLEVGIARGAYQFEYDRVGSGIDAMAAGAAMRELIPAVQKLWQGDYAHEGEHWSFPMSTCVPRPLQKPSGPLWVAARDPSSHDFAVSHGCNVMVTPLWQGDDEVASLMSRFNTACAAHPDCLLPHVPGAEAHLRGRERRGGGARVPRLQPLLQLLQRLVQERAPDSERFHTGIHRRGDRCQRDVRPRDDPPRNLVIGKPDEVIQRLKAYESRGYDDYSFWIDSGMSFAQKKRSLDLFIREVMPAFDRDTVT